MPGSRSDPNQRLAAASVSRQHGGRWSQRSSRPRSRRRLDRTRVAIAVSVAAVVALPVALLAMVVLQGLAANDWHEVARVNGAAADRASLRSRMAFDAFLDAQIATRIRSGIARGQYGQATATQLEAGLATSTDPVTRARSGLVDDLLLQQLATQNQITIGQVDPWAVLAAWIDGGLQRELRWVTIDPAPPGHAAAGTLARATDNARGDLAGASPISDLVASLQAAGWQAGGGDTWLAASGPVQGVPDELVDAARRASAAAALGPFPDRLGGVALGWVVSATSGDRREAAALLQRAAADAHVDGATVGDWATAEVRRQALEAKLVAGWTTTPVDQVHGAEIVVGPSAVDGTSGPWVELAALRVASANATAVAAGLQATPWPTREAAFMAQVAAAGSTPGTSGEMGFLTQNQLTPELGSAAFATTTTDGQLVGPLTSSGVTYLYLVEARYAGTLDDRSAGALAETRQSQATPNVLTAQLAPGSVALATDSGWFARSEFPADDPTGAALFDTPIGARSDPVALEGDLALFVPLAHRTAVPQGDELARIRVEGFTRWYTEQLAAATVVLEANPLPELGPSATPTIPVISPPALPTPVLPSALPGGLPLGTPGLPGGLPTIGFP